MAVAVVVLWWVDGSLDVDSGLLWRFVPSSSSTLSCDCVGPVGFSVGRLAESDDALEAGAA